MAKIINNEGISVVLKKLNECRRVSDDGKGGFEGFLFNELICVMGSFVDLNNQVPASNKEGIISSAVLAASRHGPISEKTFLDSIKLKESEYLKKTFSEYYYLSSLSFQRPQSLKKIQVEGLPIVFENHYPKRFSRDGIQIDGKLTANEKLSTRFTKIRVKVSARCPASAFDAAQCKIDYLRGIWNILLNPITRWSSGFPAPPNAIYPGPFHTLHKPDGTEACKWYRYEPNYPVSPKAYSLEPKFSDIRKIQPKFIRGVNQCAYKEDIIDSIVKYSRAFDLCDHESAFLKSWSIIEFLTATGKESYDTTIRRSVFLCKDKEYHKAVLDHLRSMRNETVHRGYFSGDPEKSIFILKRYLDQLLKFHIFCGFRFKSLAEAAEFLSLPPDTRYLAKRVKDFRNALKFMGYYDVPSES